MSKTLLSGYDNVIIVCKQEIETLQDTLIIIG